MDDLKSHIREVPDFPKPGILFYDVTTLLGHPEALRLAMDRFNALFDGREIDRVVGIESRGFLFGPALAYHLGAGFVPVRKPGKLPAETVRHEYDLEYGSDAIEMHSDAVVEGDRVLIVDDLIATGGTAEATARLIEGRGARIEGFGFLIELSFLNGRARLGDRPIDSLLTY